MSTERSSANGQALADRQAAARARYLESLADGRPLTGAELGRAFDRSERWGRARAAEATRAGTGTVPPTSAGNDPLPVLPAPATNGSPAGPNGNPALPAAAAAPPRGSRPPAGRTETLPPPVPGAAAAAAGSEPAAMPAVQRITTAAVAAVAAVAAAASYDHQRHLATIAGEGWRAWLLPISVDGLVVAGSMTMLLRRRAHRPAGWLAWTSLLLGVTASVLANIIAADPSLVDQTVVERVVAAWPPIALLLAYELLMQQAHLSQQPTPTITTERYGT
jgi:hypothetical protein